MAKIYLDESGFTGSDLLSKEQPLFVVSSLWLNDEDIQAWMNILEPETNASELKYANMVKFARGRKAILSFAEQLDQNQNKILFQLVNKRYALLGKLLDCIVEPMYYASGNDFYKDGYNLQYLNALYYSFLEVENDCIDKLLAPCLRLFRKATLTNLKSFMDSTREQATKSQKLKVLCEPILEAIEWRQGVGLDDLDKSALELQVSSVVSIIRGWNEELSEPLEVLADESKEIKRGKDVLLSFADSSIPRVEEKAAGHVIGYPLKLTSVQLCSSKSTPGIQLADIAAGLLNHAALVINDIVPAIAGFSEQLLSIVEVWPRVRQVIPEQKYTAEELGRVGFDGSVIIDGGSETIKRLWKRNINQQ